MFGSGRAGGEWVRGLGLGFTKPGGTGESGMCVCFGCGVVGSVGGRGVWRTVWARIWEGGVLLSLCLL